ncbi:LOW QUALITY PROTEIN: adhesion G-protein coupled receptor G7 [Sylvia borin]
MVITAKLNVEAEGAKFEYWHVTTYSRVTGSAETEEKPHLSNLMSHQVKAGSQSQSNTLHNPDSLLAGDGTNAWHLARVLQEPGGRCNHTTNFVLLAFLIKHKKPLDYISYIGVGLSMAGLLIIFLFIFSPKPISTDRTTQNLSVKWMLVCLCFSMLIFNIFLSGTENQTSRKCSNDTTRCYQQYFPHDATSNLTSDMVDPLTDSWCTTVAVLLHCFLLATFLWSALSSALLLLLRAMKALPGHFLIQSTFKESCKDRRSAESSEPLSIRSSLLLFTVKYMLKINMHMVAVDLCCWLAAMDQNQNFSVKHTLWSFLLPVALILLFKIFIRISISVIWKKMNLVWNKKDSLLKNMISTISIVVVLGITWMIGYLMLSDEWLSAGLDSDCIYGNSALGCTPMMM